MATKGCLFQWPKFSTSAGDTVMVQSRRARATTPVRGSNTVRTDASAFPAEDGISGHCVLRYGRTSASARRGAAASLGETIGSDTGQSIPIAGSFHAIERSYSFFQSAVHLYTT